MSNEPTPSTSFTSIVSSSLARETIARLPCSTCRQNTHIRMRRALPDTTPLPPVLVFNAGVRTADELELWTDKRGDGNERKRWIRSKFSLGKGPNGEPIVTESGKKSRNKAPKDSVEYELRVSASHEHLRQYAADTARFTTGYGRSDSS